MTIEQLIAEELVGLAPPFVQGVDGLSPGPKSIRLLGGRNQKPAGKV